MNQSDSRDSAGQFADLRTRIAAVLPKIFDLIADGELVEWGDMADVLIRALLEPERDCYSWCSLSAGHEGDCW